MSEARKGCLDGILTRRSQDFGLIVLSSSLVGSAEEVDEAAEKGDLAQPLQLAKWGGAGERRQNRVHAAILP